MTEDEFTAIDRVQQGVALFLLQLALERERV